MSNSRKRWLPKTWCYMRLDERIRKFIKLCSDGDTQAVRACIENGAGVDWRDEQYRSGLHWAAFGGHKTTVLYLVNAGATLIFIDSEGKTPAALAHSNGFADVGEILSRALMPKCSTHDPDLPYNLGKVANNVPLTKRVNHLIRDEPDIVNKLHYNLDHRFWHPGSPSHVRSRYC